MTNSDDVINKAIRDGQPIVIQGETMPMNINDVKTAIMFGFNTERKSVMLMCNKAQDIPYVKRALIQLLGQPNSMMHHELHYGECVFSIMPSHVNTHGYSGDVYYVAYKDDADWRNMCIEAGVKQRQVPYELMPWLSLVDIYHLLIRDGNSPETALHKMYVDGLIDKGEADG